MFSMDRGTIKRSEGRTRDISEDDAFVFADARPPREIQLVLQSLPSRAPGIERKTSMEADGKVLRVEQTRGRKECEGLRF